MNYEKHPFMFKCAENYNTCQYLGSDGLPIEQTYNLYCKKCEDFKAKARKYLKNNLCLKNSILHHTLYGYESSEKSEQEVLLEREEHIKLYKKNFQMTFFDENLNSMYKCFTGKSKRIRIIRELSEKRKEKFSDNFDKKRNRWFTRYCILSRFIQGVRKIILLNRLEKVLTILKRLTPETITEIENQMSEKGKKLKG